MVSAFFFFSPYFFTILPFLHIECVVRIRLWVIYLKFCTMMLLGLLYFSIYLQYTTPSFCFSLGMLSLPLLLCYLLFVKKQKMFILFAYCKEESCLLVLQVFTVVFIVVPLLLLGVYSYLFLYYLLACLLSFFSRIE